MKKSHASALACEAAPPAAGSTTIGTFRRVTLVRLGVCVPSSHAGREALRPIRRNVDCQPTDRRHLRNHAAHAAVDRGDDEDVAARVARAPDADSRRVDAVQRLHEGDRVAVVADLSPRV